jgi:hypothetical protein
MRPRILARFFRIALSGLWAARAAPFPILSRTTAPPAAVFEPDPTAHPNPDREFAADSYYPDEPVRDAAGKIAWAQAPGVPHPPDPAHV